MKKYYILIACLLFSLKLSAASLSSFSIDSQYLLGANLKVSETAATEFKVNYNIVRYLKGYGYEKINWIVTVVYQKEGESEIELTTPITLTESILTNSINYRTAIANIPAGKVGGTVRLRMETLAYDDAGNLINNTRTTDRSSVSYTTAVTPPVIPPVGFNPVNAHLFAVHQSGVIRRMDIVSGGFENLGYNWANTQGIAYLGGSMYITQSGNLHKVNPSNGSYNLIGESGIWNGTEAVAASSNGYLYIVQNKTLHKVDPVTGNYNILGSDWGRTEAMVAYNGYLYIIQNSTLHKVNENTGSYALLSGQEWGGTSAIASAGNGFIYIVQNGYLHKVNTNNGQYEILGGQNWTNTYKMGMAYYNNSLYILQNARLYQVNKDDGSFVFLGNAGYTNVYFLTSY